VLPTNWKLAMEAFMEGFHTPRTHPQLTLSTSGAPLAVTGGGGRNTPSIQQLVEHTIASLEVLGIGMGGGMVSADDIAIGNDIKDKVTLPEDPAAAIGEWMRIWNDEITSRGRARGVPMPDLNAIGPVSPVQFVFPHYFLLPMFGNMASYRIRPLTPETCLFELWSLILYPEDEKRERPVAPTPVPHDAEHFPPIPAQDYGNLPLQQLGLHANGFEYMRLARNCEGLISNYQRLIDGYLEGADPGKLLQAMQHVTGAFDTPIADIGL
jgi:carnitine monooxygenase subunit